MAEETHHRPGKNRRKPEYPAPPTPITARAGGQQAAPATTSLIQKPRDDTYTAPAARSPWGVVSTPPSSNLSQIQQEQAPRRTAPVAKGRGWESLQTTKADQKQRTMSLAERLSGNVRFEDAPGRLLHLETERTHALEDGEAQAHGITTSVVTLNGTPIGEGKSRTVGSEQGQDTDLATLKGLGPRFGFDPATHQRGFGCAELYAIAAAIAVQKPSSFSAGTFTGWKITTRGPGGVHKDACPDCAHVLQKLGITIEQA